jgi:hypothetical protein
MTKTEALAAIHEATGGDIYDAVWQGGEWMVETVETHETIEDFIAASANYAECSKMQRGTVGGVPAISFAQVQVRKGVPRRPLSILDLGDIRVAVNADVSDYYA